MMVAPVYSEIPNIGFISALTLEFAIGQKTGSDD